jgi:hypothetical protein
MSHIIPTNGNGWVRERVAEIASGAPDRPARRPRGKNKKAWVKPLLCQCGRPSALTRAQWASRKRSDMDKGCERCRRIESTLDFDSHRERRRDRIGETYTVHLPGWE